MAKNRIIIERDSKTK